CRVGGSADRNRQAHRIEDVVGREKILVEFARPELPAVCTVASPPVPHFEPQLFAPKTPDVYRVIVCDVVVECRLRIVLAVERWYPGNIKMECRPVGAEQMR